ncbi:MAG: PepSY-like domain-containing protein [Culturomica sp.]|jgi:hypothetical protein|nr:PepSY-like domain-containing protein [Culturomica sp.]
MKTRFLISIIALFALSFVACNDDDNYTPENSVVAEFERLYPNATSVDWERKGNYFEAEFYLGREEKDAWFDASAHWLMTKTDLHVFTNLPAAVKTAFETGDYKTYYADDAESLERADLDVMLYIVDAEQGRNDFDLVYTEDGTFLEAIPDSENNDVAYIQALLAITVPE